jgi:glycosyltransferase involved in cell wall biosynthesis
MGGSQILVQQLSERLVANYDDEVTVFTTNAYHMESFWTSEMPMMSPGIEIINGVKVRRFSVFNRLNQIRRLLGGIAYRLRLPYNDWMRTLQTGPIIPSMIDAIAQSEADIVFAATFPLMHMYYALRGAYRADHPLIYLGAIHTADAWGYDRRMIYQAIKKSDAYIALTPFEQDYLVERGIDRDKISVTGPGVDLNAFAEGNGTAIREKYNWGRSPVVAMIAKQTARKRFDVLLRAMQHVWTKNPDTHLLLAGARTPYSQEIMEMIQQLPRRRQTQITVVSDFAENEKPNLLAACDIFVLPSGEESFGISFLEAWACGKPVIGAHIGAIPTVINEGEDGLLAENQNPNDLAHAILTLLGNPQRREQIGRAGLQKVQRHYTWESVVRRIRTVYKKTFSLHQERTERTSY